jgi:CubicO group peptidase (beta-lactamase class C family)
LFQPGTKWQYSNYGIAALGRIIEAVSGQPYETFIAARIFQPLGMRDSFFFAPEDKKDRQPPVYLLEQGQLKKADWDFSAKDARYPYPEGGMSSTAEDLAAFYQMMLNGGVHQGRRILSQASVNVMTGVNTPGLPVKWGLGWQVRDDPSLELQSPGAFGHGGAFGTYGWVDPKKDLIGVFLVQRPGADEERRAFVEMTAAAIAE